MGIAGNDDNHRPRVCPQVYADRNKAQRLMVSLSQAACLPGVSLSSPPLRRKQAEDHSAYG